MKPKFTYEAIFMRRNTLVRKCGLTGDEAHKIWRKALRRKGHCMIIVTDSQGAQTAKLLFKVNAIQEEA